MIRLMSILAFASLVAAPAIAQSERVYMTSESATRIVEGCLAWAEERGRSVTIAVYDDSGNLKAFHRMDNALIGPAELAQWKGQSAALYPGPTGMMGQFIRSAPEGGFAPRLSGMRGGVNINAANGQRIGGVGVGGAGNGELDEECAVAGLELAGLDYVRYETDDADDGAGR